MNVLSARGRRGCGEVEECGRGCVKEKRGLLSVGSERFKI